jgi:bacterioferritin-associated ferredoxin
MYVCVCMAVTEAEVDATIAGGATTREAVTRACRAGGDCGACHQMIEDKIEDRLEALAQAERETEGAESGPIVRPGLQPLAPVHADLVSASSLVRQVRARNRAA